MPEAAAVQSFPNDFEFIGTTTSVWRQIGNAVPPVLAFKIGNSIKEMIKSKSNRPVKSKTKEQILAKEKLPLSTKTKLLLILFNLLFSIKVSQKQAALLDL